jgi:histidinol-phosphate aminotransferase
MTSRSSTVDVEALVRADVVGLEPYAPVYPFDVVAARLGIDEDRLVKLDANENPYGAPPAVREALSTLRYAHIYPDPESRALRAALAEFTGLPAENLLAGAGADELIDLLMRLFVEPGDVVVDCPPTFGMYAFDAAIAGADLFPVRRRADFSVDVDGVERAVRERKAKLVFLACPNNPDGGWLDDADLQRLLDLPAVVVLDEAYVEFAGVERSRIGRVLERDNLIVLRSFSKWAGLAGLRVGFGGFPTPLLPHLWKIKQPYNVSMAAAAAAIAVLEDQAYLSSHISRMRAERERIAELLSQVPYLRPYPSQSTFVLCKVVERSARELKDALEKEGILIRYFDKPGLDDHVRFSVGRPDQTDTLLEALRRA